MDDLQKYLLVNSSETLEDLAETIMNISTNDIIEGRTRNFSAEDMAAHCQNFRPQTPEFLTRNYGIRQQAMMINHYMKLES